MMTNQAIAHLRGVVLPELEVLPLLVDVVELLVDEVLLVLEVVVMVVVVDEVPLELEVLLVDVVLLELEVLLVPADVDEEEIVLVDVVEVLVDDVLRVLHEVHPWSSGKTVKLRPPQACGPRKVPSLN